MNIITLLAVFAMGIVVSMDGIYSWILYATADSYRGDKQTFARDHFVRLIRILIGIALVIIAGVEILND